MTDRLHVLAIGNAIVDLLSRADDSFLVNQGLIKGSMRLIDEAEAHRLYDAMGPAREVSGGSAANSIAAMAMLGARVGFVGRVRNDQLGEVFAHDIRAIGAEFTTPAATEGPATARCFILVTPDGQRTMNTFLGASTSIRPEHLDMEQVARADVLYIEGYSWDAPETKQSILDAIRMAHHHGNRVAFTLSDSFCVGRHRPEFLDLIKSHVDILFANEAELCSLYETEDFEAALSQLSGQCEIAAITRSEKGVVLLTAEERHDVPGEKDVNVVDTTGAGDLFAGGFLYGFTTHRPLPECGRIGNILAAEILSHFGARPETDLKELLADRLAG